MNGGGGRGARAGRRRGRADTRTEIIAAGRLLFAQHGFDATSLRGIAREAGVDPSLVHHYFAGKEELFSACVELPADPREVLADVAAAPVEERAEVLLRTLLALWASPLQPSLLALVRGAVASDTRAALLRELLVTRVLGRILADPHEDPSLRRLRLNLVAGQLMGLILTRHVIRLEPLASMPAEQLVRLAAPAVQHYLSGKLDDGGWPAGGARPAGGAPAS